jgi:hypothetical protein
VLDPLHHQGKSRARKPDLQFRGLESNQHRRVQSPASYLLDDPGVAEEGFEPPRPKATAFETAASAVSATRPFVGQAARLPHCGQASRLPNVK